MPSRQQRDHREQGEEGLREAPVEDRQGVLEEHHAEAAEHPLRDDSGHRQVDADQDEDSADQSRGPALETAPASLRTMANRAALLAPCE